MKILRNFKNIKIYLWGIVAIIIAVLVLMFFFVQVVQTRVATDLENSLTGQITITGEYRRDGEVCEGVLHYPRIIQIIREVLGTSCRIVTRYSRMLPFSYKGQKAQMQFTGVNSTEENPLKNQLAFICGSWEEFEKATNNILLPLSIVQYYKINLNERITITAGAGRDTLCANEVNVAGIFQSRNYFLKNFVVTHLRLLQKLDKTEADTAGSLCVYLPTEDKSEISRGRLLQAFSVYGYPAHKPIVSASTSGTVPFIVSLPEKSHFPTGSAYEPARLVLATSDELLGNIGFLVAVSRGVGLLLLDLLLFVIGVVLYTTWQHHFKRGRPENNSFSGTGRISCCEVRISRTRFYIVEDIFLTSLFILLGIGLTIFMLIFINK